MITKSPALQKNMQLQITKRIIRQTYKLYKWLKSPCKGELREQVLKAMRREITQNISHLRSRKPKVHGPQTKEVGALPKRRLDSFYLPGVQTFASLRSPLFFRGGMVVY